MSKIKSLERIQHPTAALDVLLRGQEILAPHYQRVSIDGTIHKMKYTSSKRFSCKKKDNESFTVTRIQ